MGLFSKTRALSNRSRRSRSPAGETANSSRVHICRVEQLEPRQYLSASTAAASTAPINVGVVYYQQTPTDQQISSLFYISWSGGAAGTQLTNFTINTDQNGSSSVTGNPFFHNGPPDTPNAPQYEYVAPGLYSQSGLTSPITLTNPISAANGGMLMTVACTNFNNSNFQTGSQGGMLVVQATVNDSQSNGSVDPVVDGTEFAGSTFTATFTNSQYYSLTVSGTFGQTFNFSTLGLNSQMPTQNYNASGSPTYNVDTDGASATAPQVPLPTISGTVFEDLNGTKQYASNDPGVADVPLTLYEQGTSGYVSTGQTTTTDQNGNYSFTGLQPGTYSVVETPPSSYIAWNAIPGQVSGTVDGSFSSVTDLTTISLQNSDNSIQNDFALVKPVTLSGYVYFDQNDNGNFDTGEQGISGATVQVQYVPSSGAEPAPVDVTTQAGGSWSASGLTPGQYVVSALPVSGYDPGSASAGTVNGTSDGTAKNPGETVNSVALQSGQAGVNYDFGELQSSLSGEVFADLKGDYNLDLGDPGIPNVTVSLLNSSGTVVKTTTTDADGNYSFNNLTSSGYSVEIGQLPSGYLPGKAFVGSEGGQTAGTDEVTGATLPAGTAATDYNFCAELPASLSGTVYIENLNGNPSQQPLSGVSIQLRDASGNAVGQPDVTGSNGTYSFTNLAPGTYSVVETVPSGDFAVSDSLGTISNQTTQVAATSGLGEKTSLTELDAIALPENSAGINYDFVVEPPASISGYVFQDGPALSLPAGTTTPTLAELQSANRNGLLTDSGVTRIGGATLVLANAKGTPLTDANGNEITTTSDSSSGSYQFTNLDPSQSYSVLLEQPSGYVEGIASANATFGGSVVNLYSQPSAAVLSALAPSVTAQGSNAIVGIAVQSGVTATNNNFSELKTQVASTPTNPTNPTKPTNPTNPDNGPVSVPPELPALPMPGHSAEESPLPASPLSAPATPSHSQYMAGGGASNPPDNTWHLSVVDGGEPRQLQGGSDVADDTSSPFFNASSWTGSDMQGGEFILADRDGAAAQRIVFGLPGATPVAGDWNGDGHAKVGVYLDGQWFLDLNGDGKWDDGDLWARLGHDGDQPVTGDWDGDGKTDIGIFGPAWSGDAKAMTVERGQPHPENRLTGRAKNIPPDPQEATDGMRVMKKSSHGRIRADVIDHVFRYGGAGDRAVVGDWKGTGVSTIGVFREGVWYLDVNGDGKFGPGDMVVQFGQAGDIPVVGDWTGDGITKLGVFRAGTFYLDTNNNHQLDAADKVIPLGKPGDRPVVGDFDGSGVDEVGVYHDRGGSSGGSQAAAPAAVPVQVTAGK